MTAASLALATCPVAVMPGQAQDESPQVHRAIESLEAMHNACRTARERVRARLYTIDVSPGWRLQRDEESSFRVDDRRNLSAMNGRVSLLLSGLETIAFEAGSPEAATALSQVHSRDIQLRVGFFLGFDEPMRPPCLIRNAHAVTVVRADLAYAELRDAQGRRIGRMQTDRLRAWGDDTNAFTVPGEGPRGVVSAVSLGNAVDPPSSWAQALGSRRIARTIGRCHRDGLSRNASREGQIMVRLNVETRSGSIRRADVSLSSVGDPVEAECVAQALGRASLQPAPRQWSARAVDLEVTVRVAAD